MRRSSSTTTSVPTDIGENVEYFMMSDDIMDKVSLTQEIPPNSVSTYLEFDGSSVQVKLDSLSAEDDGSLNFEVQRDGIMMVLLNHFLDRRELVMLLGERRFKVELLKLDSDECYLRSKR